MKTCLINNSERNKRTTSSLAVCSLSDNSASSSPKMDPLTRLTNRQTDRQTDWPILRQDWNLFRCVDTSVAYESLNSFVNVCLYVCQAGHHVRVICTLYTVEISLDHLFFFLFVNKTTNEHWNRIREQHE